MGIFRLYKQRRAGGSAVVHAELAEQQERTDAIPVLHQALREAFNIPNPIPAAAYDPPTNLLERPLALIEETTPLHPPNVQRRGYQDLDRGIASFAAKAYRITEHLGGTRFFDATAFSQPPHPLHTSPLVTFFYYDRLLEKPTTGFRLPPSGGIATTYPQFAAVISDGREEKSVPTTSTYAGLTATTTVTRVERKHPTRVCVLGEIDANGATAKIRRLIVDGKQLELTPDNIGLGLAYAKLLAAQIFAGKHYNPTQALQLARAAHPRAIFHGLAC